jgi:hypothetical protein
MLMIASVQRLQPQMTAERQIGQKERCSGTQSSKTGMYRKRRHPNVAQRTARKAWSSDGYANARDPDGADRFHMQGLKYARKSRKKQITHIKSHGLVDGSPPDVVL